MGKLLLISFRNDRPLQCKAEVITVGALLTIAVEKADKFALFLGHLMAAFFLPCKIRKEKEKERPLPLSALDAGLPVPKGATAEMVALGGRIYHGKEGGAACTGCHCPNA